MHKYGGHDVCIIVCQLGANLNGDNYLKFLMEWRSPIPIQLATILLPPRETKGSAIPTTGKRPRDIEIFINIWPNSKSPKLKENNFWNACLARIPIIKI